MKTLLHIIIIFYLATICSCKNSSTNKTETTKNDSSVIYTSSISSQTIPPEEIMEDTISDIIFQELSINLLNIYREEKKLTNLKKILLTFMLV